MKPGRHLLDLVLAFSLLLGTAAPAVPAQYWLKTYGQSSNETGESIQKTPDGNFIVACHADYGFMLLKIDINGTPLWYKQYSAPERSSIASLTLTPDGGFIVLADTESFGAGYWDIWLLRLDSQGGILWQKTYGGSDYDLAADLCQTKDGGYLISGRTSSFGSGEADIWLLRLSGEGNIVWEKAYGWPGFENPGGIYQVQDGIYLMSTATTDSFDNSSSNIFLAFDDNGTVVSQKKYWNGDPRIGFVSLFQISDGTYFLEGSYYPPITDNNNITSSSWPSDSDILVAKLDNNWNMIWGKTYRGLDINSGGLALQTRDDNYIMLGSSWSLFDDNYIFMAKLTNQGDIISQRAYTGCEDLFSIQEIENDGFILAGYTQSYGAGTSDIWIMRVDNTFNIPDCGFAATSNIEAKSLSVNIQSRDVNIQIHNTNAIVQDTNIVPEENLIKVQTFCQGDSYSCPADKLYGGGSQEVQVLRAFRDNVLKRTSIGQKMVKLYYSYGQLISKLMDQFASVEKSIHRISDTAVSVLTDSQHY